jgi:DNA-directed RNA polymerase subunit E'/Rpb7
MTSVKKKQSKRIKNSDIFTKNCLNRNINLPFESIGENIKENLLKKLQEDLEGKCAKEGFIKKNSINILLYTSGIIKSNYIIFNVVFECYICRPVENMLIKCKVINNTKAGIRAEYNKSEESPIVIFVARDHNYKNQDFQNINISDIIQIKVIGIRYELNDTNISVLGEFKKKYT